MRILTHEESVFLHTPGLDKANDALESALEAADTLCNELCGQANVIRAQAIDAAERAHGLAIATVLNTPPARS